MKTATTGPAKLVPNRPPTANPMPASAAAYRPRTSVPATGVAIVAPGDGGPDRDPDRRHTRHDATPTSAATAAGRDPAAPRQRRREQHLEPAGGLVRGPAGDQRRRREAGEDHPELDEERAGGTRRPIAMSTSGKTWLSSSHEVGRLLRAAR